MNEKIISCATHDFIEIACTFGYPIKLELMSGSTISGTAITTLTSKDKKEFLIIQSQQKNIQIELHDIKTMTAMQPNPHFDSICF